MQQSGKRAFFLAVLLCAAVLVGCGGGGSGSDSVQQGQSWQSGQSDAGGQENEFGELSIEDVTVYINSNRDYTYAQIRPVFSIPEKAEELTYTYDEDTIEISDGIVIPLKRVNETVNVRAESEHFSVIFRVEVSYIRLSGEDAPLASLYDLSRFSISTRTERCKGIGENTTVLLGDSFMDDGFIGDYMREWGADKDVLNAGISSTTSYHWEAAYSDILGDHTPKNIAVHVGTNNFYDAHDLQEDTIASLQRLLMMMHTSYPTSNIYWFTITQRADTSYAEAVDATNAAMKSWCAEFDWLTCVDTSSKVTTDMLKDGVHPKTEYYSVFTDALAEAGCEISAKQA